MSGYSATMEVAKPENRYYKLPDNPHIESKDKGRGDWLEVLNACLDVHDEIDHAFAGAWVNKRTRNWFPGLSVLETCGLVIKRDTTRGGQRAYWQLRDPEGVRSALTELGFRE